MSEFNSNEEKINIGDTPEALPEVDEMHDDTPKDAPEDTPEENTLSEDTEAEVLAAVEAAKKAAKRAKRLRDIIDYIEIGVVAVGFVIVLFSFCCRLCTVSGPSMKDTLANGERVVISDLFYTPKRNDIIVFHDTNTLNEPVVKRVIATEGETVDITYTSTRMTVTVTDKDGNVTVLEEDYIVYEGPTYAPDTYVVPEGHVFVMGDNRSHSMDSRDADIGFVDERSILGRVLFRVTPFPKFGTVK